VPALNLKAKKSELYELQLALDRDAKRGCVQGHSNRDELLREIGRSLTDWLGDIWRVVYEGKTHFGTAHSSLMLCAHVLESLESTRGGCVLALALLYSITDEHPKLQVRIHELVHSRPNQASLREGREGVRAGWWA
jgi:hypothetical protein